MKNKSQSAISPNQFQCPICKKPVAESTIPTFPFCSAKCRLLDLGNWLDGKYGTSRPLDPSDDQSIDDTGDISGETVRNEKS